jgi:hypothetical protein
VKCTQKWKGIVGVIIFILLVMTVTGCEEQQRRPYTVEDNKQIATLFVLNSPTYASSGKDLELTGVRSVMECADCYEFTFEFMAAGYGSRNMLVDPTIRKHTTDVLVRSGKVVRAVIDDTWDELAQRNID